MSKVVRRGSSSGFITVVELVAFHDTVQLHPNITPTEKHIGQLTQKTKVIPTDNTVLDSEGLSWAELRVGYQWLGGHSLCNFLSTAQ